MLCSRQRFSQIGSEQIIIAVIPDRRNFPPFIDQSQRILERHSGKSAHLLLRRKMINDSLVTFFFYHTATYAADACRQRYLHIPARDQKTFLRIHHCPMKLRIPGKDKETHNRNQKQHAGRRCIENLRFLCDKTYPLFHALSTAGHGCRRAHQIRHMPLLGNNGQQCLPVWNPFLFTKRRQRSLIAGQLAIPFGTDRSGPYQWMKPVYRYQYAPENRPKAVPMLFMNKLMDNDMAQFVRITDHICRQINRFAPRESVQTGRRNAFHRIKSGHTSLLSKKAAVLFSKNCCFHFFRQIKRLSALL